MSLMKCRDCTKQISVCALACPHCGWRPFRWERRLRNAFFLASVVGLACLAVRDTGMAEVLLGIGIVGLVFAQLLFTAFVAHVGEDKLDL